MMRSLLKQLLIEPTGIEITERWCRTNEDKQLLIEPTGIEMDWRKLPLHLISLLIEPTGIEIV